VLLQVGTLALTLTPFWLALLLTKRRRR
jgi:hypothetical protein